MHIILHSSIFVPIGHISLRSYEPQENSWCIIIPSPLSMSGLHILPMHINEESLREGGGGSRRGEGNRG